MRIELLVFIVLIVNVIAIPGNFDHKFTKEQVKLSGETNKQDIIDKREIELKTVQDQFPKYRQSLFRRGDGSPSQRSPRKQDTEVDTLDPDMIPILYPNWHKEWNIQPDTIEEVKEDAKPWQIGPLAIKKDVQKVIPLPTVQEKEQDKLDLQLVNKEKQRQCLGQLFEIPSPSGTEIKKFETGGNEPTEKPQPSEVSKQIYGDQAYRQSNRQRYEERLKKFQKTRESFWTRLMRKGCLMPKPIER